MNDTRVTSEKGIVMPQIIEMAEFLRDPLAQDRDVDVTDHYETVAKPMVATLDDGTHLVIDAEWYGPVNGDTMAEVNNQYLIVNEVDDETWQRILDGDTDAWIDARQREDMEASEEIYEQVLDTIYDRDYKIVDMSRPGALEASRGVREMIELENPTDDIPLTSDYFVASLNDGTYAAVTAQMWDHDPTDLETFKVRAIDKELFETLLDGRPDTYERHEQLTRNAPELTNHDARLDQTARTIKAALEAGDYTPTFNEDSYGPPTIAEIREARMIERIDEFGHMGEDGTIEIENMDAYLNFLRDIGADECIAQKTAPDKLERVAPGTTFTTYVVDDRTGAARVEEQTVTATEEKCWKRTAYDTEGNVITADLDGTQVPNEWLQTEAQVRKASMMPEGASLDDLDGQLLSPNPSERHLITTPWPIHFKTEWGEQTIYEGGALIVTDLKTNAAGEFEGNGNAAYGIGKVEFERRHTVVETLVGPEKAPGPEIAAETSPEPTSNIDPEAIQRLMGMAEAYFGNPPEPEEAPQTTPPSTEGIRKQSEGPEYIDEEDIPF